MYEIFNHYGENAHNGSGTGPDCVVHDQFLNLQKNGVQPTINPKSLLSGAKCISSLLRILDFRDLALETSNVSSDVELVYIEA